MSPRLPFESRPFTPAWWAVGPHQQTLGARVLRAADGPPMVRERWDTPDGDFLDVDLGPDPGPGAPVVLVLHGLEGSSRRRYVRSACTHLFRQGARPVALNFRGCSGEPNRRPRLYHSGEVEDPSFVLRKLRERHPGRPLGAWGFSLGGNALLRLVGGGQESAAGLPDAAVAMSIPFDLAAGGALLERTRMGRLYTAYFLRSLRSKLEGRPDLVEAGIDPIRAAGARTLREFDDAVTAPLHGFRNADRYYRECSSAAFLRGIGVPTLVLHARDDPFLPPDRIPRSDLADNPSVTAVLPERGGHVGFLQGSPWRPHLWGEAEGARFLRHALGGG